MAIKKDTKDLAEVLFVQLFAQIESHRSPKATAEDMAALCHQASVAYDGYWETLDSVTKEEDARLLAELRQAREKQITDAKIAADKAAAKAAADKLAASKALPAGKSKGKRVMTVEKPVIKPAPTAAQPTQKTVEKRNSRPVIRRKASR